MDGRRPQGVYDPRRTQPFLSARVKSEPVDDYQTDQPQQESRSHVAAPFAARVKREPVDDYQTELQEAKSRIAQLNDQFAESERRASEAESRIVQLNDRVAESERRVTEAEEARDAAEIAQEQMLDHLAEWKSRYEALQASSEEEMCALNQKYNDSLSSATEKSNRAREAEAERDAMRERLNELIGEGMARDKEQFEKEKADLKAATEDLTRRLEESEKERTTLFEAMMGLNVRVERAERRIVECEREKIGLQCELEQYRTKGRGAGGSGEGGRREEVKEIPRDWSHESMLKQKNDELEERLKICKIRVLDCEKLDNMKIEALKKEVEKYRNRCKEGDKLKKDLEKARERVAKMEKEREKLLEELKVAKEVGEKKQKEWDDLRGALLQAKSETANMKSAEAELSQLKARIQNSIQQRAEDKRKVDAMEKEIETRKGRIEDQQQLSEANAFLTSSKAELVKELETKTREEADVKIRIAQIEEERIRLYYKEMEMEGRREEVARKEVEVEQRRVELARQREQELAETGKYLSELKIVMRELETKVEEKEQQLAQSLAEAEKERVRFAHVNEEMEEMRQVNAFLASTTRGKIYAELEQSREKEAELSLTIEAMTRSASKWKEEEEEDEVKRKRPRKESTKREPSDEEDENVVRKGVGEVGVDEPTSSHSSSSSEAVPIPPFLREFTDKKEDQE